MIDNVKNKQIKSLNYLGGIAVLMVILVHTSQQISGFYFLRYLSMYGMMGVQILFFISGFGLTLSANGKGNLVVRNFYKRRISRIAPGYYFGIILYFGIYLLLIALNVPSKTGYNYTPFNIMVNVLLLNGLVPKANNNIVPGGWSIGTIVMFYLVFPVIYYLYKKWDKLYLFAPCIALVLSMIFNFVISHTSIFLENPIFFYNHIFSQLPVFLTGMSAYFSFKNGDLSKVDQLSSVLGFTAFTGISGLLLMKGSINIPILNTLTSFSSGISFLFLFIYLEYHQSYKLEFLNKINRYSYTIYLIHFIFAVYLSRVIAKSLYYIPGDILITPLFLMSSCLSYYTAKKIHFFVNRPLPK